MADSNVRREIVLVHGAWHGAWCWERVVPLLEAAGHRAVVVDLPSVSSRDAGLRDDAACVRRRARRASPARPCSSGTPTAARS